MKPRILIFSIAYDPLVGGAELAVRNITDRLSSYEFDLITCRFNRRHKAQEKLGNVTVHRVGFGSRIGRYLYPVLGFRLAAKLHRQNPYKIVWSIMAAYAGAAALMFLRRNPEVKFLLTLQEGDPIEHIHRQVRGFHKQWQRIFKRADYITAISQYLADWARAEGAICPIEVVPNGVELEKFVSKNSSPASPAGRHPPLYQRGGEGEFKIITVSRLVPKNGIDVLIKSLAVIASPVRLKRTDEAIPSGSPRPPHEVRGPRDDEALTLQILGSGPEEKTLKKLTRDLKVEEYVKFLGDVPSDKIPNYLAKSDIFVRPSRSEGLGTAFLEAMAAGLPVIGTAVGGITEFLIPFYLTAEELPPSPSLTKEGVKGEFKANGLFVRVDDPKDLAEKIMSLLKNEDLRRELGQNGRRLVEKKYDWDLIAKKIAAIFAGLVS